MSDSERNELKHPNKNKQQYGTDSDPLLGIPLSSSDDNSDNKDKTRLWLKRFGGMFVFFLTHPAAVFYEAWQLKEGTGGFRSGSAAFSVAIFTIATWCFYGVFAPAASISYSLWVGGLLLVTWLASYTGALFGNSFAYDNWVNNSAEDGRILLYPVLRSLVFAFIIPLIIIGANLFTSATMLTFVKALPVYAAISLAITSVFISISVFSLGFSKYRAVSREFDKYESKLTRVWRNSFFGMFLDKHKQYGYPTQAAIDLTYADDDKYDLQHASFYSPVKSQAIEKTPLGKILQDYITLILKNNHYLTDKEISHLSRRLKGLPEDSTSSYANDDLVKLFSLALKHEHYPIILRLYEQLTNLTQTLDEEFGESIDCTDDGISKDETFFNTEVHGLSLAQLNPNVYKTISGKQSPSALNEIDLINRIKEEKGILKEDYASTMYLIALNRKYFQAIEPIIDKFKTKVNSTADDSDIEASPKQEKPNQLFLIRDRHGKTLQQLNLKLYKRLTINTSPSDAKSSYSNQHTYFSNRIREGSSVTGAPTNPNTRLTSAVPDSTPPPSPSPIRSF